MKRLAIVLMCLAASSAYADTLPPDLVKAVKDYDLAQTRNDTAALGRLVTDDFVLVNSNAAVEDKRQFLADFHLPGFRIEPYVWEQKVAKAWGDGAITGGLLHLRWTQDGKHPSRWLRISYVWQTRDGHWRATYAQVTRVP
jgi:ketosteroid isomerase-like protein